MTVLYIPKTYDFCFLDEAENAPRNSEQFFTHLQNYDFYSLQDYPFTPKDLNRRIVFYKNSPQEEFSLGQVFEVLATFSISRKKDEEIKEKILDILLDAIEQNDIERFSIYDNYFLSSFNYLKNKRINLYKEDVDLRLSTPASTHRVFLMSALNDSYYTFINQADRNKKLELIFEDVNSYLIQSHVRVHYDAINIVVENLSQTRASCTAFSYQTFLQLLSQKWQEQYLSTPESLAAIETTDQIDLLSRAVIGTTLTNMSTFYRTAHTTSHMLSPEQEERHRFLTYFYNNTLPQIAQTFLDKKSLSQDPEILEEDILDKLTNIKDIEYSYIENGYLFSYLHKMIISLNIKSEIIFDNIYNTKTHDKTTLPNEQIEELEKQKFQKMSFLLTLPKLSDAEQPLVYGEQNNNYLHLLFETVTIKAFSQMPYLDLFFKKLHDFISSPDNFHFVTTPNDSGLKALDILEQRIADKKSHLYEGNFSSESAYNYFITKLKSLRILEEKMVLEHETQSEHKNIKKKIDKIHKL